MFTGRRITMISATLVLSAAPLAMALSSNSASADSGVSQFCKDIANYYGISDNGGFQGACVSYYNSNGNSSASISYFCKQYIDQQYGVTQGDCVSTLNQFK